MLKELIKPFVARIPGIGTILTQRDAAVAALSELKLQNRYPRGHFYSPVPSEEDIEQRFRQLSQREPLAIPGINLRLDDQLKWCERIASYFAEHPFHEKQTDGVRYYFDNETFVCSDALFLYGMMRELKPQRVVEIGSGFSSAVMLDTNERFLANSVELTFIEPFPDRLEKLLSEQDRATCRIIDSRIQDVSDAPWRELSSGDILFIDSSHVSKCGSDVNQLIFEVLPSLAPGVVIHIHDVFPNFEYPESWHRLGRCWSEDYLLRAFLQFNKQFNVLVWPPLMIETNPSFFEKEMPPCLRDSGGSFWMQRIA